MSGTARSLPNWVRACALGLILFGIALPEALSWLRADFTSSANYLSEQGAVGSPYFALVSFVAFPMVGLCTLGLLAFVWRRVPSAKAGLILIAIGIPVGYFIGAAFPCDAGCPVEGSSRQAVHNLGGLLAYTLGALGFLILSFSLKGTVNGRTRLASFAVGAIMIISFAMMLDPAQAGVRGLWQRLADYGAFLFLIALIYRVRKA